MSKNYEKIMKSYSLIKCFWVDKKIVMQEYQLNLTCLQDIHEIKVDQNFSKYHSNINLSLFKIQIKESNKKERRRENKQIEKVLQNSMSQEQINTERRIQRQKQTNLECE
ncbi:hypothetical protein TTHERM_00327360 (macronuclear) [Tetrahymena thermophila SB210]|uniref:Uncharacterized protein n=1 Tax=Tetrahymena thermophila (strain SB210) TaxID=312017 RepID=I7M4D2_TETTS|nr:hypothetical protein TTHERM_00327360 [Tetrahymena thermophila SB210]EAS06254.1 hypothetical protein TTHERM_00327360 [Tetrahymena thermophila SB210]|eukprot:XP_001026499.1 hypothetical protein TTHERM_00327360 [Tetrahymena thermophila SB210]